MGVPHDTARVFAVIRTDSHESRKYVSSDKLMDNSPEAAGRDKTLKLNRGNGN
jgi:hypothetical protein